MAEDAIRSGISALFVRWTALRLASENSEGPKPGRQIARELLDATISLALDPKVNHPADTFESLFYDRFDRMSTDVEDGSLEQIAREVCRIRDAAARGDFGPAQEAVIRTEKVMGKKLKDSSSIRVEKPHIATPDRSMDKKSSEAHGVSSAGPVDDDGFTLVVKKNRRCKPKGH